MPSHGRSLTKSRGLYYRPERKKERKIGRQVKVNLRFHTRAVRANNSKSAAIEGGTAKQQQLTSRHREATARSL